MMSAGGEDDKIIRAEPEGVPDGRWAVRLPGFLANLPRTVNHIEKIMFFQHTVRMLRRMDHGDMVGGADPALLHQL